ncbi:MAG TPA: aminotransferase class I/II-fold pyridoxal phosphate-dependent enzyme [Thermoleophilaceae bacterium]|nr:aminotransferase class I/II-fold pyridoxal phosphate-dependent enzyme [Thermoleophilaceae bacterium]
MGLLDYYRQFEDVDEEELNLARRERRRREKQLALQQVPDLDLSGTEWPEFPNSEVVNASIYTARGRVNGYPDRHAARVRRALAERHDVEPERIVLGNGVAELLQSAALALLSDGDELLMLWPSYPLYPLMAARARAKPVTVEHVEGLPEAVTDRTRVLVLCNPNDPTGSYLPAEQLGALVMGLPRNTHVLVDEALVHFQDVEPVDTVLRLTDAFPSLIAFRTFSKIYGLSGLRAGYAVGSNSSTRTLDAIAPVLGVNALTQAAVDQALRIGGPEVQRRRASVIKQRTRLLDALRELPVEVTESQANFVWLAADGMSGFELANRLVEQGVIVAPGGPLGADDHIRATIRNGGATDRLLNALERTLA